MQVSGEEVHSQKPLKVDVVLGQGARYIPHVRVRIARSLDLPTQIRGSLHIYCPRL